MKLNQFIEAISHKSYVLDFSWSERFGGSARLCGSFVSNSPISVNFAQFNFPSRFVFAFSLSRIDGTVPKSEPAALLFLTQSEFLTEIRSVSLDGSTAMDRSFKITVCSMHKIVEFRNTCGWSHFSFDLFRAVKYANIGSVACEPFCVSGEWYT